MQQLIADPLLATVLTLTLVPAFALFLAAASRRGPRALVWIALALCALPLIAGLAGLPLHVAALPAPFGWLLGVLLLFALAVTGGDPLARTLLDGTMRGSVRETAGGGILILPHDKAPAVPQGATADPPRELLRGGTLIGYLERFCVTLTIVAGFPEGLAVIIALKGIGRFSELSRAEARERFLIGSLASLGWAAAVAIAAAQLFPR